MTALSDIQRKISEVERLKQQEQQAEQARLNAEKEHQRKIAAAEKELRELRRQELTVRIAADKDANQAMVDQSRRDVQTAQAALTEASAAVSTALDNPLELLRGLIALAEQQNGHAIRLFNDVSDFAYQELRTEKRAELVATYGSDARADIEIERQVRQSGSKIGSLQTAWSFNVALGLYINAAPTLSERNLRRALAWYLTIELIGQETPSVLNPPLDYTPRTDWHYPNRGG